ncbi:hypothetical protein IMZ48_14635 [Candidatus Bathyarchaeota archaeon]|nr:hypothetical protein [Candidatus Bathyarchaeota archaeon]
MLGGGKFQTRKAVEEREKVGEGLRSAITGEKTEEVVKVSEAQGRRARTWHRQHPADCAGVGYAQGEERLSLGRGQEYRASA